MSKVQMEVVRAEARVMDARRAEQDYLIFNSNNLL